MINTNEILKKYDLKPTKTLGQNFLTDINIIRKIADAAEVCESDLVLEIGPGIGAMTVVLAERAGKVIAVEIDKHLIPPLSETLKDFGNITLVNGDIMKTELSELTKGWTGPLKVVSNLPYYITTPVIMRLLESSIPWDTLVFMVQREVAQRMAASPGTKDYGALSLAVKYYSDPLLCFAVSRNCFIPKPDVDSAVVKLKKRDADRFGYVNRDNFFKTVRASFGQRRKTLLNSLGTQAWFPGGKERLRKILNESGIDENIRAEDLSIEQFASLADKIFATDPS